MFLPIGVPKLVLHTINSIVGAYLNYSQGFVPPQITEILQCHQGALFIATIFCEL